LALRAKSEAKNWMRTSPFIIDKAAETRRLSPAFLFKKALPFKRSGTLRSLRDLSPLTKTAWAAGSLR
jgi:hypothetical protein